MKRILAVVIVIAGIGNAPATVNSQLLDEFLAKASGYGNSVYTNCLVYNIFNNPGFTADARRRLFDYNWVLNKNSDGAYTISFPNSNIGNPTDPMHPGDSLTTPQLVFLVFTQQAMEMAIQYYLKEIGNPFITIPPLDYMQSIITVVERMLRQGQEIQDFQQMFSEYETQAQMGQFLTLHHDGLLELARQILTESHPAQIFGAEYHRRSTTEPTDAGRAGLWRPDFRCFLNAVFQEITIVNESLGGFPNTGPVGRALADLSRKLNLSTHRISILPEIQALAEAATRLFPFSSIGIRLCEALIGGWVKAGSIFEARAVIIHMWQMEEYQAVRRASRPGQEIPPSLEEFLERLGKPDPPPEMLRALSSMHVINRYLFIQRGWWRKSCGHEMLRVNNYDRGDLGLNQGWLISDLDEHDRKFGTIEDCIAESMNPRRQPPCYNPCPPDCPESERKLEIVSTPVLPITSDILSFTAARMHPVEDRKGHRILEDDWNHTMPVPETILLNNETYKLAAMIMAHPGHYTAMVRLLNGKWVSANDKVVVELPSFPKESVGSVARVWTFIKERSLQSISSTFP
ncbi:MAG: hypothetical protein LBJ92_00585 [Holosporales bacterium]|jgi:hypothetical protein|nr:hypothetical protein [Holosporales bacterium]